MLIQLETSRRAGWRIVVEWEVPVGVCIASARRDVCRIDHVCVDEFDFVANAFMEISVTFFNVLAPELHAFEQLGTFRYLAAELVHIFLKDEL